MIRHAAGIEPYGAARSFAGVDLDASPDERLAPAGRAIVQKWRRETSLRAAWIMRHAPQHARGRASLSPARPFICGTLIPLHRYRRYLAHATSLSPSFTRRDTSAGLAAGGRAGRGGLAGRDSRGRPGAGLAARA